MSSAKIRLFLTIEKLKNAMEDPQMTYPVWEYFFPLLGDASSVRIDLSVLSELIGEAADVAEQVLITQGGMIFSQYSQQASAPPQPVLPRRVLLPPRAEPPATTATSLDTKKYHSFAEKMATHFISASVTSVSYYVKDVVKFYLYVSRVPRYKPLFDFIESALFRKERECIPNISSEQSASILDNLRDLTSITNIRLDYESMMSMNTGLQHVLNNGVIKYPDIKIREYISNVNVYEKEVEPYKAYADKFALLLTLKVTQTASAASSNELNYTKNPLMVEKIAENVERNCDMNRMVYNAINNIFINIVEQSAAENIKFDMADYNKRFRMMDRVRENARINYVDKVAVGDVGSRKRIKTISTTPTIHKSKLPSSTYK
ncbi:P40 [Plodia interpunctella granulovirus]|uniref:p40 n=1 Tax=Plodia interpunctella granulovirus TaxID=262175 RepID=A0A1L5JH30_9BBAC|nr:P40 [Plodia interpunctella granulovirus]APO13956.1 P40 [Plodia interpunctella granulovirus]